MAPPSSSVNHISNPYICESKSRFMKWLSKLFKSTGSNRGGGDPGSTSDRHRPQFLGEESMVWPAQRWSLDDRSRKEREKEELDRAIALSLAEDLKRPDGQRWRTDSDEDFARALPDSTNPSYPPYGQTLYYPRGYKLCGGCNRNIGYGNYLGCTGTYFHPECFRCRSCGYPITDHEFSLSGRDPYHKSCFKELTDPKCEVCHQFVPINEAGLIEYRCHPFWSQKYCLSHEHDNTSRCCSCERLESWNSRYYSLEDGRSLCLECMESTIMDTGDCQPLYHAIRDYYEGMNMKLEQQIPILLVERQALNEAIVGEKNVTHDLFALKFYILASEGIDLILIVFSRVTITCLRQGVYAFLKSRLSQVYDIRRQIQKRPRLGSNRLIGMRTQPQKLTRRCEVTAILVLYGLPRLLTGAILSHELMHGWLRLKGYRNLNPEVEEGICQVLSHMWLESEVFPGSRDMPSTSSASSSSKIAGISRTEKILGKFFMHQIAHDTSSAYGGGFRTANTAVNKYGLRRTLDHIRLTGNFPL